MWMELFAGNKSNRDIWIKKQIAKIPKGESLLDAGAGEMQYKSLCKDLKYTSQDFNQYDGLGDGQGLQMEKRDRKTDITSDIIDIPVEDNSFDNVLCTEVLEHLPYPDKAVKEFARVLKKWGKLILTAPFCSLTHFAPYHFCTGFNKYWYEKMCEDNGLVLEEVDINGNFFDYMGQEVSRVNSVYKMYGKYNAFVGIIIKALSLPYLLLLRILSKKQKWSEELLSFWMHIVATKK